MREPCAQGCEQCAGCGDAGHCGPVDVAAAEGGQGGFIPAGDDESQAARQGDGQPACAGGGHGVVNANSAPGKKRYGQGAATDADDGRYAADDPACQRHAGSSGEFSVRCRFCAQS